MIKFSAIIVCVVYLFGCNSHDGETILETGTIEATEITLSAQSGGQVKRVIADEGDNCSYLADTLLFIDNTDWVYQLQQARGGYEMAEAQFRFALNKCARRRCEPDRR